MAVKEEKRPQYTIKCHRCVPINKWDADYFTVCPKCGNEVLDADDHTRATSRRYAKGVEIAK